MEGIHTSSANLERIGITLRGIGIILSDPKAIIDTRRIRIMRYRQFWAKWKSSSRPKVRVSSFFANVDLQSLQATLREHTGKKGLVVESFSISDDFHRQFGYITEHADLILLSNNDLFSQPDCFREIIKAHDLTWNSLPLLAIWDYDNHNKLDWSLLFARYFDLYWPAHEHLLFHYGCAAGGFPASPNPCPSSQFSALDILRLCDSVKNKFARIEEPLGMHNFYSEYKLRTYMLSMFSRYYERTGFLAGETYNSNEATKNLEQYTRHTCTIVAPIAGDVPIRTFDSLLTGSIPIVPELLQQAMTKMGIPSDFFYTYSLDDCRDPRQVVSGANQLYYKTGVNGQLERIRFALNNFHIDRCITKLLCMSFDRIMSICGS